MWLRVAVRKMWVPVEAARVLGHDREATFYVIKALYIWVHLALYASNLSHQLDLKMNADLLGDRWATVGEACMYYIKLAYLRLIIKYL